MLRNIASLGRARWDEVDGSWMAAAYAAFTVLEMASAAIMAAAWRDLDNNK